MALFPTQKTTWDALQKTKDSKNNCGRPGVNGGFIADSTTRFGVNCYGKKPSATKAELQMLSSTDGGVNSIPQSPEDQIHEAKIRYMKKNKDQISNLNGFNRDKWSQF